MTRQHKMDQMTKNLLKKPPTRPRLGRRPRGTPTSGRSWRRGQRPSAGRQLQILKIFSSRPHQVPPSWSDLAMFSFKKSSRLPVLARNGHGPMSDLSPLSGEERKSNFGAVRSVEDPERTSKLGICLI